MFYSNNSNTAHRALHYVHRELKIVLKLNNKQYWKPEMSIFAF